MTPAPIRYSIQPTDPAGHLFTVRCRVPRPAASGQRFALPAWIPGSYMIREFARNVVRIHAESDGAQVPLRKLDKHTWSAEPCAGALTVTAEIYAYDLSVRAAHLDPTHGYFNGTSVFLQVEGQEHAPRLVEILRPEGKAFAHWRVITALAEARGVAGAARRRGFGLYRAADYDELIDHPVEMGEFALGRFDAHGLTHEVAITGSVPGLDMKRLCADLKPICEAQIELFEPRSRRAPSLDMSDRYVFMALAVGDGYGGLEHRASTSLICSRADLPVKGQAEVTEGYQRFLGLCSHEYFHTWNVKRIKPSAFAPYDLATESYTTLLWAFEGFTSYYDDLILVRSGRIDIQRYLDTVGRTISGVLRGTGRHKQSVAESSFDAWIKYYRQDENSPNAIVSYYAKGSLVAMALDLTIRARTKGRRSLDDVMRLLWSRFGRDFHRGGSTGVGEEEFERIADEASGLKLARFFDRAVRGTGDLPLAALLKPFGVAWRAGPASPKPTLGVKAGRDGNDCKLLQVLEGGAAHAAGLSALDVLVAIDGLRVTATNLDVLLSRYRAGDRVRIAAFRRDELHAFDCRLLAEPPTQITLKVDAKAGAAARRLREEWLRG